MDGGCCQTVLRALLCLVLVSVCAAKENVQETISRLLSNYSARHREERVQRQAHACSRGWKGTSAGLATRPGLRDTRPWRTWQAYGARGRCRLSGASALASYTDPRTSFNGTPGVSARPMPAHKHDADIHLLLPIVCSLAGYVALLLASSFA
jgi:hypothetical protein